MKVLAILLVGAALRAALFLLLPSSILDSLRQRVELSTPFTSHKRCTVFAQIIFINHILVEECLYLLDHQYPLYDGGLCHHVRPSWCNINIPIIEIALASASCSSF